MNIEHMAIWTKNLDQLVAFYEKYFEATAGNKYINPNKGFESYFLSFSSGARLELMRMASIPELPDSKETQFVGYNHLAFSTGAKERVDDLTERLRNDGFALLDGPRWTGDGYYESVVLDPDGNRVEITI
jgi:lactoylglutathione lyase